MRSFRGFCARHALCGLAGLATLLCVAALAATAVAAPLPSAKTGAIANAPEGVVSEFSSAAASVGTLYSNTSTAASSYYAGQGGHEAIDDLHLLRGGSLDSLVLEYHDPAVGGTFSATLRIYGNPSGLDLDATPLLATYVVNGLQRGRRIVSVPLPDAPVVSGAIWIGVQFSSPTAGLLINSIPSVGSSHDYYLEDGGFYNFGGTPKANFALRAVDNPFFGLTIGTVGSGLVTKSPDQGSYAEGTLVELSAAADPHWHFVGWSGAASGNADPLSLLMDGDKSITATFAIDSYTLVYAAGPNGTLSGVSSQTVGYGQNGTSVTAIPDAGYAFTGWSDGVSTATRTELSVTGNVSVTATFAPALVNALAITIVGPGTVSKSPDQPAYAAGAEVLLTATADPHAHFQVWGGDASGSDNPLSVMMNGNKTITATFAIDAYSLTYAADPNGSISGLTSQTVAYGQSGMAVTAVPNAGYAFTGWSDGVATETRTELSVTADVSVTATFAPALVNALAITIVGPGTVSKNPDQLAYAEGAVVQLAATAEPNAHFVSWSGGASGSLNPLSVVMSGNQAITATFAMDTFALTYVAGPNGTIFGSTMQSVAYGATGSAVTAIANAGYDFAGWSDGVSTATRTDQHVIANLNVTANFTVQLNPTVTADFENGYLGWKGQGGGKLQLSGEGEGHLGSAFAARIVGPNSRTEFGIGDSPRFVTNTGPAGRRYRLTAWVRSETSRGSVRIRIREYHSPSTMEELLLSATPPPLYSEELTLSSAWQQLALDVVTMRANSSFDLQILDSPQVKNEVFLVDDISAVANPLPDQAPQVNAPRKVTVAAGALLTVDVLASDLEGQAIAALSASGFIAVNPPTFTPAADNRGGRFVWRSAPEEVGNSYTVTFTAQNALSGSATMQIKVVEPPTTTNLCMNGTFERDTLGWSALGTAVLSRASEGRNGGFALQIRGGKNAPKFGSGADSSWLQTTFSKGSIYRCSLFVKSPTHHGSVRIDIGEFVGGLLVGTTSSAPVTLSTDWQLVRVDHTVLSAGSALSMYVSDTPAEGLLTETFLMDDVSIIRVGGALAPTPKWTPPIDPTVSSRLTPAGILPPTVSPNPAFGKPTLELSLTQASVVRAEIYDMAGRRVQMLAEDRELGAGTHRFVIQQAGDSALKVGVYFYRVQVSGTVRRGRFVILGAR